MYPNMYPNRTVRQAFMQPEIPTCSTKTVEIAGDSSSIVILHSPEV